MGPLERRGIMPTISMFYGIIVRMYNTDEHNPPHFYAKHGDENAS